MVLQVGCATLFLTLGAVLAGRGLDGLLGTGALFTILFLLASVPLVGYLNWRIALSASARLNPPAAASEASASLSRESEVLPNKEE
jgi:hypothetical protein